MKPALAWGLRLIPAIIIAQTLPFKFTGAAESVALFSKLGGEALGNPDMEGALRIGTGILELIAVVLLLIPRHSLKGALLVVGTMAGALSSHLFFIGFGGYEALAVMAVIALACSAFYIARSKVGLLKLFGRLK